MIQFHNERNFVSIFSAHERETTQSCGHGIAATLDCQFYNIFWIEIDGVWSEGCASGMFNSLVHGQYGKIASIG